MKIAKRIKNFLNRNNPELISEEIAQVFRKRKESGEKDPMDNTVRDIMKILKEHPDIEKAILANIAENEKIPDKIFEKTATQISKDKTMPDSIITDAIQKADVNIPDETINNIIEEGKIDVKERINLLKNVDDIEILKMRVKNELKILYKNCYSKKDSEVVERMQEIENLLNEKDIDKEIKDIVHTVIARKMAENYYSDLSKGTNIYTLSKIIPAEEMIEIDIASIVEKEYRKIEKEKETKKGRFNKKEFKEQILEELGKQIGIKYGETGIFIVPQSENIKKIDEEEKTKFIKAIQIYSRKQLSKAEIIDINEQIRGESNNVQIKENILVNAIKKIPENNKVRSINFLIKVLNNKETLQTLSMLDESGLIEKFNEIPEEKREKTIDFIGNALDKRKVAKSSPKIKNNQKIDIYQSNEEGR